MQAPIGGPSIAPALPDAPESPPAVPDTGSRSGRVFVQPRETPSMRPTTIGVSVGIGVLLIVGISELPSSCSSERLYNRLTL